MKFFLMGFYALCSCFIITGCQILQQDPSAIDQDIITSAPNIIFLLSDDQRFDALGVAGNPILQTHFLDSLANNGIYFPNACATSSICCVSRASIMSGQYARRHNITDFNTGFSNAAFEQTFPMLLKKAGYNIGFIGKYGVGEEAPKEKFDFWRGFNGQGHYNAKDAKGKFTDATKSLTNRYENFMEDAKELVDHRATK